jgi:hypothetical protein
MAGLVLHFFFLSFFLYMYCLTLKHTGCINVAYNLALHLLSAIEWFWVQLMEDNKRDTQMILGVGK